jgi:uncharacterized protein YigE (DUF2233 family)
LDRSAALTVSPLASIDSLRGRTYVTYTFAPQQTDIRICHRPKPASNHTFASLAELAAAEGKSLTLAMNGGMFRPDYGPQGLLVIEGEMREPLDTARSGYGNFYLQPNGIFALDTAGRAYVIPTQQYDSLAQTTAIAYATQSGPLMVDQGQINPLFNDGSPNVHIRNAVGTTPQGQVVLAISQQEITFFQLSTLMIQQGCDQALYLDGFVSQLYLPALSIGSLDKGTYLGPLIAIFDTLP